jgi:(1->4)-alpha-D-glucan 1-alpha-D-glucosylmutase
MERMLQYVKKALREAKVKTSWTKPDEGYERNVRGFVDGILKDRSFVSALENFVGTLVPFGRINSLAQTLLKLTSPGVPDLYQGTELLDFSLVDPDNRRSVDYELRRSLLRMWNVRRLTRWSKGPRRAVRNCG